MKEDATRRGLPAVSGIVQLGRPGRAVPVPPSTGSREVAPGAAGCATDADGTPACCAPEEPTLIARGWTRRFVGDNRMVEDAIALYGKLGYEVMCIPLDNAKLDEPCLGCEATLRTFRVLYTRPPET